MRKTDASPEPGLRPLLEVSPDPVLVVERSGRIVAVNRRLEELFGLPADGLIGQPVEVLLPEHARGRHAAAREAYASSPTARAMSARTGLRGRRADGSEVAIEIALTPILNSAEGLVMAVVRGATGPAADEAAGVLEAVSDAILTTDAAGRVALLNPAAEVLTGWTRDRARGRPLPEVLPLVSEATGGPMEDLAMACLGRGESVTGEGVAQRGSGDPRVLDVSTTPIRDAAGAVTGAVLIARDVTHARRLAQQLTHQATHDGLTGLVNRPEFERRLANAVASTEEGHRHAVCFLDLDGFKRVNDVCGHAVGDDLLRQLSDVMRARMRSRDTLARLGGDEFGLLLEHCPRSEAVRIAHQIRRAIGGYRFTVNGAVFTVGASLGVAVLGPGSRGADVLKRADMACYLAKHRGGNRVELASPDRTAVPVRRGDWGSRLRRAVEENRLQLYAQPLVSLGEVGLPGPALELLLRLDEGAGEPLLAKAFLPAAGRCGLVPVLDRWVVHESVSRLGEWQRAHPDAPPSVIALNLGDETVATGCAHAMVMRELAEGDVHPASLCFEISETTVTAHPTETTALLHQLRATGCRTTIEHCGNGMAAFTLLRKLRPDFIKIAGHIVRGLPRDPVRRALAKSLNDVGHLLGLGTIGCEVENGSVLSQLHRLGVDYAQGFGIGRPEPLADAVARLA
jgi:diguanylate cyclase (GGDEF)-like protein/PAS domain S-box-containing protein